MHSSQEFGLHVSDRGHPTAERWPKSQYELWALAAAVVVACLAMAAVVWLGLRTMAAIATGVVYGGALSLAVIILAARHLACLSPARTVLRGSSAVMWSGWLYGVLVCAFFAGMGGWTAAGPRSDEIELPVSLVIGWIFVANLLLPAACALAAFVTAAPLVALLAVCPLGMSGRVRTRVVASLAGGTIGLLVWPIIDRAVLNEPGTLVLYCLLPGLVGSTMPAVLLWLGDGRAADGQPSDREAGFP